MINCPICAAEKFKEETHECKYCKAIVPNNDNDDEDCYANPKFNPTEQEQGAEGRVVCTSCGCSGHDTDNCPCESIISIGIILDQSLEESEDYDSYHMSGFREHSIQSYEKAVAAWRNRNLHL